MLHRITGATLATIIVAAAPTIARQDDPAAARARQQLGAQIDELGTTLRAAAMSGAITGEEARAIYNRVTRAAKASYIRDFGDGKSGASAEPTAKTNVAGLAPARPDHAATLLRPEFMLRDMQLLQDDLDLDRNQMGIVKILFNDYEEAFALASAPLREGISQYHGATMNAFIGFALEGAGVRLDAAVENIRRVGREEAAARMAETLAGIDSDKAEGLARASDADRERYEAWKDSMIAATVDLDDRLAAIRERTSAQIAEMGRNDAAVTADDLIALMNQLRTDRDHLRADLTESLELITTEAQRGEVGMKFERAMARVRIGQVLSLGRLGGESMNLWAAMMEAGGTPAPGIDDDQWEFLKETLDAGRPGVAAILDARTDASIEREITGFEFRSVRDEMAATSGESIFAIDDRRLATISGSYASALRREIAASVAARDALIALLEESSASIDHVVPGSELADRFRASSLRRGFPVETRRRWAERALAASLELEELDDDVFASLVIFEAEVAAELQTVRGEAISKRIRRDPTIAIDFIRREFEYEDVTLDDDVWREIEYEAFTAVDDRTESNLRGLLTAEQFELLPSRGGLGGWNGGKGKGKGGGQGGSKGDGRGDGKSGGKPARSDR